MALRIYLFVFCSFMLVTLGTSFNMKYIMDRLNALEIKFETENKRRRSEMESFENENKLRRSETEELFRMVSELTKDKIPNKNEHVSRDDIITSVQQSTTVSPSVDKLKTTDMALDLTYLIKGAAIEKEENVKLRSELKNISKQLETGIKLSESRINDKIRNFTNYISDKQTSLVTVERFNNLSAFVTKIATTTLSEMRHETRQSLSLIKSDTEASILELSHSLRTMNQTFLKSVEKLNNFSNSLSWTTLSPNTMTSKVTELPVSFKPMRPSSCKSASDRNGVLFIYPETLRNPIQVYCDQSTDGGGWVIFQRRQDGSVDFERTWADYKTGFGNLAGEFWLGNDNLHSLTSSGFNELRIDLEDFAGNKAYAKYSYFKVKSESEKYELEVRGYSGDAGDSLDYHNGMSFSTKDRDNDKSGDSCSLKHRGAWWYGNCHYSNLNGFYYGGANSPGGKGVTWYHWTGDNYSLKRVEMKIR